MGEYFPQLRDWVDISEWDMIYVVYFAGLCLHPEQTSPSDYTPKPFDIVGKYPDFKQAWKHVQGYGWLVCYKYPVRDGSIDYTDGRFSSASASRGRW